MTEMDRNQWVETRKLLIDVAMGREKADLVIQNGRWVSVQSGEIIPDMDIANVMAQYNEFYMVLEFKHQ